MHVKDLAEIKQRAARPEGHLTQIIGQDLPALIAEVERLTKNIGDAGDCLADVARMPEPGDRRRRRPRRKRRPRPLPEGWITLSEGDEY